MRQLCPNKLIWLDCFVENDCQSGLRTLVHLRRIILNRNEVRELSPLLGLPVLETINAQDNCLRAVDLSAQSSCQGGSDSGSTARADPERKKTLRLRHLDLSSNQLVRITGLPSVPHMRTLNLQNNQLLDFDIRDALPRLRILKLQRNPGLHFLDVQSQPRLRTLYIDGTSLRGPYWVANLTKAHELETLSMRNMTGGVVSWPRLLPRSLKRMFLSGSTWIEDIHFPEAPPSPTTLAPSVSCDEPSHTPKQQNATAASPRFSEADNSHPLTLAQLVYMDLSHCQISQLPPWLAQVSPALRHANLSHNWFRTQADLEVLAHWPRLKRLELKACQVERTSDLVRVLKNGRVEMLDTRFNPCTAGMYQESIPLDLPAQPQHLDCFEHPQHAQHSEQDRNPKSRKVPKGPSQVPAPAPVPALASTSALSAAAIASLRQWRGPDDDHPAPVHVYSEAEQVDLATRADDAWVRAQPWSLMFSQGRALHRGALAMGVKHLRVLDGIWVQEEDWTLARRLLGHDA